jgi:hypothetical protein
MKNPNETDVIGARTIEKDLKTLLERDDTLSAEQDEPAPAINLAEALKLFDNLRTRTQKPSQQSQEQKWSCRRK